MLSYIFFVFIGTNSMKYRTQHGIVCTFSSRKNRAGDSLRFSTHKLFKSTPSQPPCPPPCPLSFSTTNIVSHNVMCIRGSAPASGGTGGGVPELYGHGFGGGGAASAWTRKPPSWCCCWASPHSQPCVLAARPRGAIRCRIGRHPVPHLVRHRPLPRQLLWGVKVHIVVVSGDLGRRVLTVQHSCQHHGERLCLGPSKAGVLLITWTNEWNAAVQATTTNRNPHPCSPWLHKLRRADKYSCILDFFTKL
jgi:hypothetical protein